MENIKFALNNGNDFEERHFGDSDKFMISEWTGNGFSEFEVLKNPFKDDDEDEDEHNHGDQNKGKAIVKLLKNKGVKVLVSKQFGRNVKVVGKHFVLVITSAKNLDKIMQIIPDRITYITEQLQQEAEVYKLVDLRR